MKTLNWGYIQLGLVALALGGLQVWWIGSVFLKRKPARPLSEGEFRKHWSGFGGRSSRVEAAHRSVLQ